MADSSRARKASTATSSRVMSCSAGIAFPRDGVDADQLDPEVAQAVEQPVELRLVGELGAQRRLPVAGHERHAINGTLVAPAQTPPNADLVCRLLLDKKKHPAHP